MVYITLPPKLACKCSPFCLILSNTYKKGILYLSPNSPHIDFTRVKKLKISRRGTVFIWVLKGQTWGIMREANREVWVCRGGLGWSVDSKVQVSCRVWVKQTEKERGCGVRQGFWLHQQKSTNQHKQKKNLPDGYWVAPSLSSQAPTRVTKREYTVEITTVVKQECCGQDAHLGTTTFSAIRHGHP